MMLQQKQFISVTVLNSIIKNKLENDFDLRNLYVKGEISNWKSYSSGYFFDLIDEKKSIIPCILWRDNYLYLPFEPKNGDEVIVEGSINVYVARGRYNLSIKTMEKFGQGAALLALEALKKRLQAEGLFDQSHKKPIPLFPKRIGIIVGEGSAAEADLIKNIHRRWPICEIYEFPSLVQGKEAPKELFKALKQAESHDLDTLIIARGGGSNEDLSAFNDEALVRELFSCKIPCISAVGHEIDTTLIDYVSDYRSSTPTGAAEAATPDQNDIKSAIINNEERIETAIYAFLKKKEDDVLRYSERPFFKNPYANYLKVKEDICHLSKRLDSAIGHYFEKTDIQINALSSKLKTLNPTNTINRGYSMTVDKNGKVVTSTKQINEGETLKSILKDGIIHSKVVSKE